MTRARATVGVFVVALLALTVHNVVTMVGTQERLTCSEVLCEEPRDIEQLSALNRHTSVSGRLANIYYLAQRIPGARLTIPPWMAEHRWHLERVGRLRVVVSDAPMLIDPERLAPIDKRARIWRRWLRSGGKRTSGYRTKRIWQRMLLVLEGPVDYVLAESSDGVLYLISTARYQAAVGTAP